MKNSSALRRLPKILLPSGWRNEDRLRLKPTWTGLLAPSGVLYALMGYFIQVRQGTHFLKLSLRSMPLCHNSCFKTLQHRQYNSGQLMQRTQLTEQCHIKEHTHVSRRPCEHIEYTIDKNLSMEFGSNKPLCVSIQRESSLPLSIDHCQPKASLYLHFKTV